MYSTAWVNQFEIKDTCTEFAISNVSAYSNDVKIKLNLQEDEICRDCSLFFCEINDNAPSFSLVLPEAHLP